MEANSQEPDRTELVVGEETVQYSCGTDDDEELSPNTLKAEEEWQTDHDKSDKVVGGPMKSRRNEPQAAAPSVC